jgi:hypothetical protein
MSTSLPFMRCRVNSAVALVESYLNSKMGQTFVAGSKVAESAHNASFLGSISQPRFQDLPSHIMMGGAVGEASPAEFEGSTVGIKRKHCRSCTARLVLGFPRLRGVNNIGQRLMSTACSHCLMLLFWNLDRDKAPLTRFRLQNA